MQPVLCIERWIHHDEPQKSLITPEELTKTITDTLAWLHDTLKNNEELLGVSHDQAWAPGRTIIYSSDKFAHRVGGMNLLGCTQRKQLPRDEDVVARDFTNSLPELIHHHEHTLKTVTSGLAVGHYFIDRIDLSRPYHQVTIARTLHGVQCPDCGHLQMSASIKGHMQSMKCLAATHDRDLRDAGWQRIDQSHYMSAVRKAGVQWDVRATEFKMWIPPWVHQAIKQYEANKGYGGLKLEHFLEKMKPNE